MVIGPLLVMDASYTVTEQIQDPNGCPSGRRAAIACAPTLKFMQSSTKAQRWSSRSKYCMYRYNRWITIPDTRQLIVNGISARV
ncbi:uncharacterized protein FTOL_01708 [Fusarium torulosum]|uniref:Uncharacterized protein n=1 Tax=Fusarium torulosum TaxID=33205 RepID=A0AAE8M0Q3_9HYPO|nr:uncharacterized protein FTOL_01708 [Fusarium torulosum]